MKPLLLLVGVAAAVAAGVMVVLWSRGPNFSLLYARSRLDRPGAGRAGARFRRHSLSSRGRLERHLGALRAPERCAPEARGPGPARRQRRLRDHGKDPGFGVSQFMENARYQHALETELARTIASLRPVEGARVHLAVPRQSAFVRDRRPASASVFVQLKAGKRLEQEQIQSIVNLVASSIPELEASHVTVVDQQGRLLSAPQGDSEARAARAAVRADAAARRRIRAAHRSAAHAVRRARAACAPRSSRSSTLRSRRKRASSIEPDSQIVRSEQTSEQRARTARARKACPGRSDEPAAHAGHGAAAQLRRCRCLPLPGAAGTAAAKAQGAAAATLQPQPRRQTTPHARAHATTKSTAPWRTRRRLPAACSASRLRCSSTTCAPRTRTAKSRRRRSHRAQLAHITQLVKDAVGFNAERGDSVNVVNSLVPRGSAGAGRRARAGADLGAADGSGHREARSPASSCCWCSSSWWCVRW